MIHAKTVYSLDKRTSIRIAKLFLPKILSLRKFVYKCKLEVKNEKLLFIVVQHVIVLTHT